MSWDGRIPDEQLVKWINEAEGNPNFWQEGLAAQLILELRTLNNTVQWFENLRRGSEGSESW